MLVVSRLTTSLLLLLYTFVTQSLTRVPSLPPAAATSSASGCARPALASVSVAINEDSQPFTLRTKPTTLHPLYSNQCARPLSRTDVWRIELDNPSQARERANSYTLAVVESLGRVIEGQESIRSMYRLSMVPSVRCLTKPPSATWHLAMQQRTTTHADQSDWATLLRFPFSIFFYKKNGGKCTYFVQILAFFEDVSISIFEMRFSLFPQEHVSR